MKKLFCITGFLITSTALFAQNDSINTRDDKILKFKIRNNLIPDYEKVLVFIADSTTGPNEVEEVIKNKTQGTKESKIFTDDKVTVESDLFPGADTNKTIGGDLQIVQYLNNFNTNYAKTESKNISLNNVEISPLKKGEYFYYNVQFESDYRGTTSTGEKFHAINRIAEVKLINDHGWIPYINSIRFAKEEKLDTVTNVFKNIIRKETDVDKLLEDMESQEQTRIKEENNKIQGLIGDGNDLYDKKDYENALKKYREAQKINYFNKEPTPLIEKAKKGIEKEKQEEQDKIERAKHIEEMKKEVRRLHVNYDFQNAKLLCDSLTKDYNVSDDEFSKLNNDLSDILASLAGIEISMERKVLKEAVNNCNEKIARARNNIYKAEFCYRMALIYKTLDKTETKKIMDYSSQAIDLSSKHHQNALKLRAGMYMASGDIPHAIEDASQLINNESRNPENYLFRAGWFESDKNYSKAIDDYGKAIIYNTKDSTTYMKKSILEFNTGKYSDAKKTASDGIEKTVCYGGLYFNRGIASDKLNDCKAAGDDFLKAKECGIEEKQKTSILNISENYVLQGNTNLSKGALYDARNQYTNAILIDSNLNALYGRAHTFIMLGKNDSAITDLDKLIRRKPDFRDAHSQRGTAYSSLKNFAQANPDFEDETKRFADNFSAWYAKGQSELAQEKWDNAGASFERCGLLSYSDSTYYWASFAWFNAKKYDKAITACEKAKDKKTKMALVYYVSGKSNYYTHNYKTAVKELETAKTMAPLNHDIIFWYAVALEANEKYLGAAQLYDQLYASHNYKDT
ncbi:MAG: tetratricopeptide repeat protein, partial [Bacteroidota bacterium]